MPNKYQEIRNDLRTGDCILIKGTGPVSRIIRLLTDYSHCYIVVRLDKYQDLNNRVFLLEAYATGIRFVLLSNMLKQKNGQIDIFQPTQLTDQMQHLIAIYSLIAAASQIKYNFGGLFVNLLRRTSTSFDKYFCSELVWVKWLKAGLIKMSSCSLTNEGIINYSKGISPRPGDIPKWVSGTLIQDIKKED